MFAFIDFVVFLGFGLLVVLWILNKVFGANEPVVGYIDENGEFHVSTDDKGNLEKEREEPTDDEGILAYIDKDGKIHLLTDDEGNFILYKREPQGDEQIRSKKTRGQRR